MKLEKVIAVRNSKTIYRDGSYVIKVFDEGYSKADILNEALNIARVEETGLPIPHVEEVTKIEGKWAIVTDYAEGKTIAQLMAENPDKKDEYLERFVDIQIEVQSKTCPMLNRLKEKMKRKISQTGLDATTRYELDSRLASMPNHNKLCHGDFNPTNVVISPMGRAGPSWTGPMPPRATPVPTPPAPTCCSGWAATLRPPRSIWTSSARRPIPPSSMCRSGCPSWPLPSP